MNLKLYGILRTILMNRAMLKAPASPHAIGQEQLQAHRLSAFLPQRLSEMAATSRDLADALNIEHEFIEALLDGTFPLSILSWEMWSDLAAALDCTVPYLRQVITGAASSSQAADAFG